MSCKNKNDLLGIHITLAGIIVVLGILVFKDDKVVIKEVVNNTTTVVKEGASKIIEVVNDVLVSLAPANGANVFLKVNKDLLDACLKKVGREGSDATIVGTTVLVECIKKGKE